MTPPPPGQQATAERHAALTPLLERVSPRHQALAGADLVRLTDWNGRTYACRITDEGRAALEAS